MDLAWGIMVTREGAVALTHRSRFTSGDFGSYFAVDRSPDGGGRLTVAWRLAIETILELGRRGPAHVALRFDATLPIFSGGHPPATREEVTQVGGDRRPSVLIERQIDDLVVPSEPDVASCHRELRRACGHSQLEPDA
jgi:hypothetical protein